MVSKVNFIYVLAVEDHCMTSFLFEIFLRLEQLFVAKTAVVQKEKKIHPALLQTVSFPPPVFAASTHLPFSS